VPYLPPPSALPPGSIVDAYVRDSGGPRQDASTSQQLEEIEAYCLERGLQLRHRFQDIARSGGTIVGRDEFNRMLDIYRNPERRPHGLLLWNYARFARDLDDAIYYKALLRNFSIIVHSLTDPIPEGPYGRVIEFFIDISNEEKRRQTSADAKRGLRNLVLQHGCVPGKPPRGFRRVPVHIGSRRDGSEHIAHRWEPDPELVPVIQRAFAMRASGASLWTIQKETLLFGAVNSFKTFFINRLYIGILEYGELVVEDYCEPLIDMDTWNAVQARIEQHSQAKFSRLHPRRANSPYLLSGLVLCARCGSPLYGNTVTSPGRRRDEAYYCSRARRHAGCDATRMGRKRLEEAVLATLREYVLIPESLAALLEIERTSGNRREAKRQQRLATLTATRRKLSSQLANLTMAIAEKGHSQALLAKLQELEMQRGQVVAEMNELNLTRYAFSPPLSAPQLAALSQKVINTLDSGQPEQIRGILHGFIQEIRAQRLEDQIVGTITYFFPLANEPPPFELSLPDGQGLSIGATSMGAPLYRQTFTHPIMKRRPS
jgi:DNA invertase Pin-like site-specific DNA recombinase